MANGDRYAVILAGGQGKRFWPLSNSRHPKQLLRLLGGRTMLQMAVDRIRESMPIENILVLTSQALVEASRAAAPELPPENIVGEPMGRDTAPAVALGCALIAERNSKAVFSILTADQVMKQIPLFRKTIEEAGNIAAAAEVIVTIGIQPRAASTSFGYIETAGKYESRSGIDFLKAKRFVEKPDIDAARQYIECGNYLWNAGMFTWSVDTLINGLARHCPHLAAMIDRLRPAVGADDFIDRVGDEYQRLEKISIDYALMENSENIVVARGTFEWDDLGSWPALVNHIGPDPDGNTVVGDLESIDAKANIVYSQDRLTALIGVENLVVVQAEGVTLVCSRDRAQDVKQMVDKLAAAGGREEVL